MRIAIIIYKLFWRCKRILLCNIQPWINCSYEKTFIDNLKDVSNAMSSAQFSWSLRNRQLMSNFLSQSFIILHPRESIGFVALNGEHVWRWKQNWWTFLASRIILANRFDVYGLAIAAETFFCDEVGGWRWGSSMMNYPIEALLNRQRWINYANLANLRHAWVSSLLLLWSCSFENFRNRRKIIISNDFADKRKRQRKLH